MQFHATLMTLLDHPFQRILIRTGRLALCTREEAAPWLHAALVEGIALRPHLEDDGVTTIFLQFVELVAQYALHLLC